MTEAINSPFFILCSGRSGSTLLASMLNMHPNLYVPVELFGLYSSLPQQLKHYGDLNHDFNLRLLAYDLKNVGQLKEFNIDFDSDEFYRRIYPRNKNLRSVIDCFYETLLSRSGRSRIGDKTPNNSPFIKVIDNLYPESKVIHLVRDGRDCAISSIRSRKGINHRNVYELGKLWPRNNGMIAAFGSENPSRYLRIRYEDLVVEPANILREICSFLNESYSDSLLSYKEGKFAQENARVLDHHTNLGENIIRNNVGKWRSGLSREEVSIYNSLAGAALISFGYEEIDPSRGVSWRFHKFLYWLATTYRRAARYTISQRIGLWRWICTHLKRKFKVYRLRDLVNS